MESVISWSTVYEGKILAMVEEENWADWPWLEIPSACDV